MQTPGGGFVSSHEAGREHAHFQIEKGGKYEGKKEQKSLARRSNESGEKKNASQQ